MRSFPLCMSRRKFLSSAKQPNRQEISHRAPVLSQRRYVSTVTEKRRLLLVLCPQGLGFRALVLLDHLSEHFFVKCLARCCPWLKQTFCLILIVVDLFASQVLCPMTETD